MISVNLDIQSTNNDSYIPYMGTLAVEVYSGSDNQVGSNRYVLPGNESKVDISFLTVVTGTYNLSIYVYNNVSTKTVQQPIMVASKLLERERDERKDRNKMRGAREREWGEDRERKPEAGMLEKGTRDERMEWWCRWTWYDNDDSL